MINLLCISCKHYKDEVSKCDAFDKIPEIIVNGKNDHSKPLPEQDNDIVFEEI